MPTTVWIGVDPGSRSTGITARQGDRLLAWDVVQRDHDESEVGPGPEYLEAVIDALWIIDRDAFARLLDESPDTGWDVSFRVAVEGVSAPKGFNNGRRDAINPRDIIGTAMVFGAVVTATAHHEPVVVPPGGNGSLLLATYPGGLVTDAERRHGLNRPAGGSATVRHARSAWDVAGAGPRVARELAALAKARTR